MNHGNSTGENSNRQLSFYAFDDENEQDLATVIQQAMLNDCPDARQEAQLAVKWGEPALLREKLEELDLADSQAEIDARKRDVKRRSPLAASKQADQSALLSDRYASPPGDLVQTLERRAASKDPRWKPLLIHAQARARGFLDRRKFKHEKHRRTSLLQIALERSNLDVVSTLLEYLPSTRCPL